VRSTGREVQDVVNVSGGQPVFTEQLQKDQQVLSSANRLLDELKKAYTQILQEKDEQVRSLKEEISDLRTLVRVLESENERQRKTGRLTFEE